MPSQSSKTLVIIGHPNPQSYCAALAAAYAEGASQAGAAVQVLHLDQLQFSPDLSAGFGDHQSLEPDLIRAQQLLKWCDCVCIVAPTWWGTYPAVLKGFIDRVLLPGFAFKYIEGRMMPEKLLTGRSARVIVTTDTPLPLLQYLMGDTSVKTLRQNVLGFCGFAPIKAKRIGVVRGSSPEQRQKWLSEVKSLGISDARGKRPALATA